MPAVTPRVTPEVTRRRTTAYTRKVISEMAARRAAEGLPLDRVLTEAASIVLEHRRRAGGHLGGSDEDSSWAADLVIDVYEGIYVPPVPEPEWHPGEVRCAVCGRKFWQANPRYRFCRASCRQVSKVRNWRAKQARPATEP